MATRTVACPECGSESAPGRYTCAACGALLDGVAVRPRARRHESEPARLPADPAVGLPDAARELEEGSADLENDGTSPFDEDQPLTAGLPSRDEPVHGLTAPSWPVRVPEYQNAREAEAEPELERQREPELRRDVSWPLPGDRGPIPVPAPRTPAGAYLPPSAVLPPLDAAATGGGAAVAPASGGRAAVALPPADPSASAAPETRTAAARRDWLAALGPPERRHAAARRSVAIGAGLGALGFVLPWVNVPAAALVATWLDVWGLAGAGHWLIVAALVALALVAALPGRAESWRLGLPGVAVAALLGGLVWPYVFGSANRPFGVLVAVVGAIVLVGGSGLDLAGRHEDATPAV